MREHVLDVRWCLGIKYREVIAGGCGERQVVEGLVEISRNALPVPEGDADVEVRHTQALGAGLVPVSEV